ncbi:hypothetical protein [Streptomyces sp. NPDC087846]
MEPGDPINRTASKAESRLREGVLEDCILALPRDGARSWRQPS